MNRIICILQIDVYSPVFLRFQDKISFPSIFSFYFFETDETRESIIDSGTRRERFLSNILAFNFLEKNSFYKNWDIDFFFLNNSAILSVYCPRNYVENDKRC